MTYKNIQDNARTYTKQNGNTNTYNNTQETTRHARGLKEQRKFKDIQAHTRTYKNI